MSSPDKTTIVVTAYFANEEAAREAATLARSAIGVSSIERSLVGGVEEPNHPYVGRYCLTIIAIVTRESFEDVNRHSLRTALEKSLNYFVVRAFDES